MFPTNTYTLETYFFSTIMPIIIASLIAGWAFAGV